METDAPPTRPDVEGLRAAALRIDGFYPAGLTKEEAHRLCDWIDHLELVAASDPGETAEPTVADAICLVKTKEDGLWAQAAELEGDDKDNAELGAMRWWKVRELLLGLSARREPAPTPTRDGPGPQKEETMGNAEKKLFLMLSPEMGDGFHKTTLPVDYRTLEEDYIRPWIVERAVGDSFTVKLVEMTAEEYERLPEP